MSKKKSYDEVKNIIESTGETLISTIYEGYNNKLDIKCHECGNIYSMNLTNFLKNKRCNLCAKEKIRQSLKLSYNDVKNTIESTGDILISKTYEKATNKLDIKCHECGNIYSMRYCNFKNGNRCPKCANIKRNKNKTLSYIDIQTYINNTGEKLVSTTYKNCHTKLNILCQFCNKVYSTTFNDFKQGENRCPYCKRSKGEEKIAKWLNEHNFLFDVQYKFKDCKYKKPLKFDFKLDDTSGKIILIEFDGIQHYKKCWYDSDEDFNERKKRDQIKNNYCNSHNNIDLYRIPYWNYNKIDIILNEIITKYD